MSDHVASLKAGAVHGAAFQGQRGLTDSLASADEIVTSTSTFRVRGDLVRFLHHDAHDVKQDALTQE